MGRYTHEQEAGSGRPANYWKYKDHRDIMMFAFRYALGRRTFAPAIVQEYIREHIDEFSATDRLQMAREIESEEYTNTLGDPNIDKPGWLAFMAWLREESGKLNPIVL